MYNNASATNRALAEVPTLEVMVAKVLKVNPLGALGRRMVKRALSRM